MQYQGHNPKFQDFQNRTPQKPWKLTDKFTTYLEFRVSFGVKSFVWKSGIDFENFKWVHSGQKGWGKSSKRGSAGGVSFFRKIVSFSRKSYWGLLIKFWQHLNKPFCKFLKFQVKILTWSSKSLIYTNFLCENPINMKFEPYMT